MEYSDFKQTVPGEGAALPLPLSTSTTPKTASRTAPWWTPLKYLIPTVLLARYIFLPLILPSSDLDFHFSLPSLSTHDAGARAAHKSSCKQAAPLYPSSFDVSAEIEGKKDKVIDWLSGAVKIPTEIYDVMGPIGKDPRWDVFYTFAECEDNPQERTRTMS
jgi:Gly-Xaa carboxypeptidase